MTFEATEIKSYLPCTLCGILIVNIGNSNVETIAGSYNEVCTKKNKIIYPYSRVYTKREPL